MLSIFKMLYGSGEAKHKLWWNGNVLSLSCYDMDPNKDVMLSASSSISSLQLSYMQYTRSSQTGASNFVSDLMEVYVMYHNLKLTQKLN